MTGDATGQDPISNYEIFWDFGTEGLYFEPLINSTSPSFDGFTYTITDILIPGLQYSFKYRARNMQGISDFSPITQIYAGTVPAQLNSASTTLVNSDVIVSWPETSY